MVNINDKNIFYEDLVESHLIDLLCLRRLLNQRLKEIRKSKIK